MRILELLGFTPQEFVGICHKIDNDFRTAVLPSIAAQPYVDRLDVAADIWYAPNPVAGPVRTGAGRGTAEQVTRLSSLYADLDVKPSGCPNIEVAQQIIDTASELLGERPSFVVFSGHGLQPYWVIEDGITGDAMAALLRRFGQLIRLVAQTYNAQVDSVFDLPRILRVPDTLNNKDAVPVEVSLVMDTGGPMGIDQVIERLNEAGIAEVTEELGSDVVQDPAACTFAAATCAYMTATIKQWDTEPIGPRHPWLLAAITRLECARRYYCVTAKDYLGALTVLQARMSIECQRFGEERKLGRYEIRDAQFWGRERAARKTDIQIAIELGRHPHLFSGPIAAPAAPPPQMTAEKPSAGQSAAITNGHKRVHLKLASSVVSAAPTWVWTHSGRGRIQLGTMALLAGRPGAGKSTAARWFAAGYSTGKMDGCLYGEPVNVAYIAPAEESHIYVIKPGLVAAGADPDRICFPEMKDEEGNPTRLLSAQHEQYLTEAFRESAIRVVVVDPVMSTIPGNIDINKNNETRVFIEPWARIAERINGVVLGVAHLTKHPGADLVAAINGSSAFGEVARGIFGFVKDRNGERIMSQVKNSSGYEDLSLTYEIASAQVPVDSGVVSDIASFVITGISELTAAEVLMADHEPEIQMGRQDSAQLWLADYLEKHGKARPKDIVANAKEESHSRATLYRAAKRLGVEVDYEGMPRIAWWRLPGSFYLDPRAREDKT